MEKRETETKNERGKMIFFDFDGTIADSFREMMEIFNEVAEDYGYDKIAKKDLVSLRKLSFYGIIEKFAIPKWKLPLIIRTAKKIFNKKMLTIDKIEGIKEVLEELRDRNFSLGILTSNSEKNVRDFLRRQKLEVFDLIFSESSLFGKDKALKKIMKQHGFDRKDMIYVGDETRDIEAAKRSGAMSVAVCWGFNSEVILKEYNPDYVVRKPKGLLKIFLKNNGK